MNTTTQRSGYKKNIDKCFDHCRHFLVKHLSKPHYGSLRCKKHGFIKWLSHKHYCELQALMYPAHSTHKAKRYITHAEKQMKKIQRLAQLQHEDAVPDFEWLPQHNK